MDRTSFYTLLIIFCFQFLHAQVSLKNFAVVRVPITDACGLCLTTFATQGVSRLYKELPYAPEKGFHACHRMHQLKYNEIVQMKRVCGDEIECAVSNLYTVGNNNKRSNHFWVLKDHLVPLEIVVQKIPRSLLPDPIDMTQKMQEYNNNTLTLCEPWCNKKTNLCYSIGTRFKRVAKKDTQSSYAVTVIDYNTFKTHIGYVPKEKGTVVYASNQDEGRAMLIALLKRWTNEKKSFICYVYGGSSCCARSTDDSFTQVLGKRCGRNVLYWQRKTQESGPLSGFDCSEMLLTAAQIVGIPFFYKNTKAINESLRLLTRSERLQEGDLLWYYGHVMIVSDIQNNLLIEAVGYESGHGKAHEIELSKVFAGITTYNELINAYYGKRHLKRINHKGKPFRSVYRLKIFKLY